MEPYGALWDHMGPYVAPWHYTGTLWGRMGSLPDHIGTLWDHKGTLWDIYGIYDMGIWYSIYGIYGIYDISYVWYTWCIYIYIYIHMGQRPKYVDINGLFLGGLYDNLEEIRKCVVHIDKLYIRYILDICI